MLVHRTLRELESPSRSSLVADPRRYLHFPPYLHRTSWYTNCIQPKSDAPSREPHLAEPSPHWPLNYTPYVHAPCRRTALWSSISSVVTFSAGPVSLLSRRSLDREVLRATALFPSIEKKCGKRVLLVKTNILRTPELNRHRDQRAVCDHLESALWE
jgi:hypothetical protein